MQETIGMRALQIPLNPFWTEHAAIEREFFPRFEPDYLITFDLELNAALLTAKTAVCFHKLVWFNAGLEARPG